MTTIAVRGTTMAADSMEVISSEGGGDRYKQCQKIFRKVVQDPRGGRDYEILIGIAGESQPAMVFMDWYPGIHWFEEGYEVDDVPDVLLLLESDFDILILEPSGMVEADGYCRPTRMIGLPFWAIGSGCKCALTAMELGCNAEQAVREACKYDPNTREPIVAERL